MYFRIGTDFLHLRKYYYVEQLASVVKRYDKECQRASVYKISHFPQYNFGRTQMLSFCGLFHYVACITKKSIKVPKYTFVISQHWTFKVIGFDRSKLLILFAMWIRKIAMGVRKSTLELECFLSIVLNFYHKFPSVNRWCNYALLFLPFISLLLSRLLHRVPLYVV